MSRLTTRPRPSATTLGRIALGWNADLGWLATGNGPAPTREDAPPPPTRVELEARYPNLVEAIAELGDKLSVGTIDAAWSMALHAPSDLEVGTWAQTLLDLERQLRRAGKTGETFGRPVLDEDDTPPAGR